MLANWRASTSGTRCGPLGPAPRHRQSRRTRQRWSVGLFIGAFAFVVLAAAPASAEDWSDYDEWLQDGVEKPYDSCVKKSKNISISERDWAVSGDQLFKSNGYSYWFCDDADDAPDEGCITFGDRSDGYDGQLEDGETNTSFMTFGDNAFCAVAGESVMLICRDEKANYADEHGAVLIPVDWNSAELNWGWWVREVIYESQERAPREGGGRNDDEEDWEWGLENKNFDAEGCALGDKLPTRRCTTLHSTRQQLYDDIARARQDQDWVAVREAYDNIEELNDTDGLVPDECWGTLPTSNYSISWSSDGDFTLEQLTGWIAALIFEFSKLVVSAALWMIGLAFLFDVTRYRAMVSELARAIDIEFVHLGDELAVGQMVPGDNFSLFDVAWLSVIAFAGFQALRGRLAKGVGELLISIVGVAAASVFFSSYTSTDVDTSDPEQYNMIGQSYLDIDANDPTAYDRTDLASGYFTSFVDLVDVSSAAMLTFANSNMEQACGETDLGVNTDIFKSRETGEEGRVYREENLRGLLYMNQNRIHTEFIERPFMLLNYGEDIDLADVAQADLESAWGCGESSASSSPTDLDELYNISCTDAIANTLSTSYSGEGWETRYLDRVTFLSDENESDCGDMSEFNGEMTLTRLMGTVFVAVFALVVGILLGLTAATMLVAKFLIALLFMLLPIMIVAIIFPGRSRQMAWWWLGSVVQIWLAAFGMGLVLAMLMLVLDGIHDVTQGMPLAERWALTVVLVAILYFLRKRMIAASQSAASAISARLLSLNQGRGGASAPWAGAGAPKPLDLAQLSGDRAMAGFGRNVAATAPMLAGQYAVAGATAAGFGAAKVAGVPFKRMAENRGMKKSLRNLEVHDMNQRRRDVLQKHMGERQKLGARQTRRTQRGLDTLGTDWEGYHRADAKVTQRRDGMREMLDGRVERARNQAGGSQRRLEAVGRAEDQMRHAIENGRPIHGRELEQSARTLGINPYAGRTHQWNKAALNFDSEFARAHGNEAGFRQADGRRRAYEHSAMDRRHAKQMHEYSDFADSAFANERLKEGLVKRTPFQNATWNHMRARGGLIGGSLLGIRNVTDSIMRRGPERSDTRGQRRRVTRRQNRDD